MTWRIQGSLSHAPLHCPWTEKSSHGNMKNWKKIVWLPDLCQSIGDDDDDDGHDDLDDDDDENEDNDDNDDDGHDDRQRR